MGRPATSFVVPNAAPAPKPAWYRRRLSDIRIRTKLGLILLVPALAVLGLGGYLLKASVQRAMQSSQALSLTELAGRAGEVAFALELERAAAAGVLLPAGGEAPTDVYASRVADTDAAVAEFGTARSRIVVDGGEMAATVARVDVGMKGLVGLRGYVTSGPAATWSAAVLRYRLLIADLLALRQSPVLAGLPAELADRVRAASTLSQAVEYTGLEHVAVARAASADRLTPAGLRSVVTARAGFEEARQSFYDLADPRWRAWWESTVAGDPVVAVAQMDGAVAGTHVDERINLDVGQWTAASVAQMRLMHQVQAKVDGEVVALVRAERDAQVRSAWIAGGVIAAVFIIAVLVAVRVGRSMVRRLRYLSRGALHVAHQELPDVVTKLAQPRGLAAVTPQQVVDTAVIPVTADGSDEIGEVSEAFVTVSREAVRHAAEQALLRAHVAAMFVAMARRLQHLTDAMLRQLDQLEQSETDDKRLAELFALDHVGTRIGRYTDSLLVVSGTTSARRRTVPVDLYDVLLAAAGQVEDYRRVTYGVVDEGVAIAAHAVDHVVHALAELIDNACGFSPPEFPVVVQGRRSGADVIVEIIDRGIGLPSSMLTELNTRLASPPRMDVNSLRSIGIATVAAIASWHGLRVTLTAGESAGTTARILVPPEVTIRAPRHLHPTDAPPPLWPMVPRLLERTGAATPAALPWPRTSPEALPRAPARPLSLEPARLEPARLDSPTSAWRIAAAAPRVAATNGAGLPVRDPMAQLVPGALPTAGATAGSDTVQSTSGPLRRDANAVSAAMRSYQLGLMQGRAGARTIDRSVSGADRPNTTLSSSGGSSGEHTGGTHD